MTKKRARCHCMLLPQKKEVGMTAIDSGTKKIITIISACTETLQNRVNKKKQLRTVAIINAKESYFGENIHKLVQNCCGRSLVQSKKQI